MKTDDLLTDLTPASASADFLVAAARSHARRRRIWRDAVAAAAVLAIGVAGIALLPRPQKVPTVAALPAARSLHLTADELLDSFGDQPVALVTYPDGSQRLLAVMRPAMRTPQR